MVAPDFFDGMEARKQVRNDLTSGFTVKHISGVYPDDEHATDGINDRSCRIWISIFFLA